MNTRSELSSSMEDYMETIAALKKRNGVARVRDISKELNVKNSSVTSALSVLVKNGLVIHEKYGYVDLTEEGVKIATNVQKRHDTLLRFFTTVLKVDPGIAENDACKLEHYISKETLERLSKFIEFVETYPGEGGPGWLQCLDNYFETGERLNCKIDDEQK